MDNDDGVIKRVFCFKNVDSKNSGLNLALVTPRYIPTHVLVRNMGEDLTKALLVVHDYWLGSGHHHSPVKAK